MATSTNQFSFVYTLGYTSWIESISIGSQSQRRISLRSGASVFVLPNPTPPGPFRLPIVGQGSWRKRSRLRRCRWELLQMSGILRRLPLPPSDPWHIGHVGQGGQGEVSQGGWQGPKPPWHCAVRCRLVQIQVWGEKRAAERELRLTWIISWKGHLRAKTSAPVTRILPRGPKLPGEGTFSRNSDERRSP